MTRWITKKGRNRKSRHIPIQEGSRKREKGESWEEFARKKNRVINQSKEWFKNLWEDDSATIEDYYELYRDIVQKLEEKDIETNVDDSFEAFDKLYQIYNFRATHFKNAWDEWKIAMWDLPKKD
jgi:chloramphenicol O-acetyltransferase